MWEILTNNLVLAPLSVTNRLKLFLSHCETHRLWCLNRGRIIFDVNLIFHETIFNKTIWSTADGYEHAFKTIERTQYTRGSTMMTIRKIIQRDWSILLNQGPMNQTNWYQINQRMYMKGHQPHFSQVACLLISCICYNTRGVEPGTAEVFAVVQTLPCSASK